MSSGMLDRDRIRELFDLRNSTADWNGGNLTDDPHPRWHELLASGPVHAGTPHELSGLPPDLFWHGLPEPDREHFSAFSFAACDWAYRHPAEFASSPGAADAKEEYTGVEQSMLMMGGDQHRRYRQLVQPAFVPAKATWWIENWINETVHALVDEIVERGQAELNVDFCAAIPVLTITGSFGVEPDRALDVREQLRDPAELAKLIAPIVEARRNHPQDDLISVLTQAELVDESGTHRLNDPEIFGFMHLLMLAGSGTTWKQMGITLTALLNRPDVLAEVRADRSLVKNAIDEALRWEPTDPMFSRWVAEDTELEGTPLPKGSVVHLCLGAANRDPERWDHPDEFDIHREPRPMLAFGTGPHVCLGMHVARAEMTVGINALLDRLPNLRLDPDAAAPGIGGYYERGAMEIPVVFDQ